MTAAQEKALRNICARYGVPFHAEDYNPMFDLPDGYVAGWVGGAYQQENGPTIYVGVSPEGDVSS